MSILGNLSDLAHEIRSGVGTVLTILGSKLEADARARVECGPQWLTEFEEQRDSLEPADMCQFHGEWCAGEASWCTRQCNKCDEAVYWHRDVEAWFHCAGVLDRRPCPYGDGPVVEHSSAAASTFYGTCIACEKEHCHCLDDAYDDCPQCSDSSAAVSAAADPSPTVPNAHSVVGGEGRGEDSDILQSASLRRSTDPGEVSPPSPGEPVREDDLAAHILASAGYRRYDLTRAADAAAKSLLADFNITRK